MLVLVEVYRNVLAARRLQLHPPQAHLHPKEPGARVASAGERAPGWKRAPRQQPRRCRLNASSSRLLPPMFGRLLAKCVTASLDAIIDWEAPSVSKRTLRHNRMCRSRP